MLQTFKYNKKYILSILIVLMAFQFSYSQGISGTANVQTNSTHNYTYDDGTPQIFFKWVVPVGHTILSQGFVGTEYYVNIQWGAAGTELLSCTSGKNFPTVLLDAISITISSGAQPAIPDAPTVTNFSGYTELTRGTPPPGETWYWQISEFAESTVDSSVTKTMTSGTIYYLRSYHNVDQLWSDARIINYTINPSSNQNIVLSNENYIHSITPKIATSNTDMSLLANDDKIESVTYFDGLGRAMQSIAIKASPDKKDIITHVEYDAYGRQEKEWLPYYEPTGNLGSYRGNVSLATQQYYQTNFADDFTGVVTANINPFSQKEMEASPLNRVLKQAAPGKDWKLSAGNEIEFDYQTNTANEVKKYEVNISIANNTYTPTLILSGSYGANELYKSITYDENHSSGLNHSTEEFKDKKGQVILKRTYADVSGTPTAHDTYYVYDIYGNLSFVLPPLAEPQIALPDATELAELCYQYTYDNKNRLVEKKIPGKDKESIVYNKLDQPILTQDALLDAQNKWLFTKYDAFGRIAYTGVTSNSSSRISLQTTVNGVSSQYVTKGSAITIDGTTIYYNNGAYPTSISDIYTINYYDNYTFDKGAGTSESSYSITPITEAKGMPTGSKVRVLDVTPAKWITSVSYYDDKSNPIYVYSNNAYLETTDKVKSKFDFIGQVEESTSVHSKTGHNTITTVDVFSYDHMGRLLAQSQTVNNGTEEGIINNVYDDLGQLTTKQVGGSTTTRLQDVDYSYNVRGWLKEINDVSSLNGDLFAFKLNYNDPTSGTALFNGNISQTLWKTANTDSSLKTYSYTYDALNRITSAIDNTGNYNLGSITNPVTYDKNGNILSLYRKGHINTGATSFGTMDNLVYTYYNSSNQLKKVLDNGNHDYGFIDGEDQTTEYAYDANGNMVKDLNKGIGTTTPTQTQYNHLNLPTLITLASGNIQYIYDATGIKLEKTVTQGNIETKTFYAGNFVYDDVSLQFFNQPEGYVKPNFQINRDGSPGLLLGFDYIYQFKDHLGNVRLSYKENNSGTLEIIEESNYYPFGLKQKGYNGNYNPVGNSTAQKFKYNGIEFEEAMGIDLYEMDVRSYDPAIARWTGIDPVTHHSLSTYNAFDNNPVFYADPSGANSTDPNCDNCFQSVTIDGTGGSGSFTFGAGGGNSTSKKKSTNSDVSSDVSTAVDSAASAVESTSETSSSNNELGFFDFISNLYYLLNGGPAYEYEIGDPPQDVVGGVGINGGARVLTVLSNIPKFKPFANSSNILVTTANQLQKKFKHAKAFGVSGNYSKANAAKFSSAINQHLNNTSIKVIQGTYRGNPVTHYLNTSNGLNVISKPNGAFISGWKLTPEQFQNVLKHGGL